MSTNRKENGTDDVGVERDGLKVEETAGDKKVLFITEKDDGLETKRKKKGKKPFYKRKSFLEWIRLIVYGLACFLTSALYFGWQGYMNMLMKSGAYRWKCDEDFVSLPENADKGCSAQMNSLEALYSYGSGSEFAFTVLAGLLLDSLGPQWTALVGELIQALSIVVLIFSDERVPLYPLAMILTGASVNVIAFPALTVMDSWTYRPALMISIVVGCQSAAAAVSLAMEELWKRNPGWTFKGIWGVYLVAVWLPITIAYLIFLPRYRNFEALQTKTPQVVTDLEDRELGLPLVTSGTPSLPETNADSLGGMNSEEILAVRDRERNIRSPSDQIEDDDKPTTTSETETEHLNLFSKKGEKNQKLAEKVLWALYWKELIKPETLIMCVYFCVQMLEFSYYPAVVKSAVSDEIGDFQGRMTPLAGPFSMIIGFFMDYIPTTWVMYCMTIAMLGTSLSVIYAKNHGGYMRFVALWFIFMQSATYNIKYTFVNELFDPYNFGKLVGSIGICGGVGAYLSGLFTMSEDYDKNFKIICGLSGVMLGTTLCLHYRMARGVCYKSDKFRKDALQDKHTHIDTPTHTPRSTSVASNISRTAYDRDRDVSTNNN